MELRQQEAEDQQTEGERTESEKEEKPETTRESLVAIAANLQHSITEPGKDDLFIYSYDIMNESTVQAMIKK